MVLTSAQLDHPQTPPIGVPFEQRRLDELLEQAGLDALVATSAHNVRYLLGGYSFHLYELADAIGTSRYLPAVAYRRGAPAEAMYVGADNEDRGTDAHALWVADVRNVSWGADRTADEIVRWCAAHLPRAAKVGVELPYLPTQAYAVLAARGIALRDATELLEELRAVKRPHELRLVRRACVAVVDATLATFGGVREGDTKVDVRERLRREQTARGLTFRYGLISTGTDVDRAPSTQRVEAGAVLSLDSGATREGWFADLARMGIAGEPTARHDELLAQVDHIQRRARALARAGVRGGDLLDAADTAIAECDDRAQLSFAAHGIGLVTHEAPRLNPHPAPHAQQPLRAGMVLSLEAQVTDPSVGMVKLEDAVIVTDDEPEAVADHGRGWNLIGG
jgi:Xaa-Pro aminopeptidase